MNSDNLNPYQAPETRCLGQGQARFRLRPWFALTLYLTLAFDCFSVWMFGFHPFLVSIPTFMFLLAASAITRGDAAIRVDDSGIAYRDLVQFVDVSWHRVVGVIHRQGKTVIATDSPLAQITVSRKHDQYDVIVDKIAERQPLFDFEVADHRLPANEA